MEKENDNKNSEILDEDLLNIPMEKYLIGNYTIDEVLKIWGVLFGNILIIIGSQLMFEFNFLARIFLPLSITLFLFFWDLVEKRNHLRWKIWVLALTLFYIFVFEQWLEIL